MKSFQINKICVVGAGPAGSIKAALLARHGHDVLLFDKHEFPRNKTCGDALSSRVMDILKDAGRIIVCTGY